MQIAERRNWIREELLVALKIYCELNFGQFDQRQHRIIEVAKYLRRTPSSLSMKLCNFASLDPAMMGKGLKGACKADKLIMQEFLDETEKVMLESEDAYIALLTQKSDVLSLKNSVSEGSYSFKSFAKTERLAEIRTRTVQHFFRNAVISSYNFKCSICDIDLKELLIASHVIPWSENEKYRADPTNGLSLCALHDRAFDRGFLTIDKNYTILLSSRLNSAEGLAVKNMFKDFAQQKLHLPFRFLPNKLHLEWHRDNIFQP